MTITMTSKNQITIPKGIVDALRLHKGSLFDVKVKSHHIEIIPLDVQPMEFTDEDYERLERLVQKEKKKGAKKVTPEFIKSITKS